MSPPGVAALAGCASSTGSTGSVVAFDTSVSTNHAAASPPVRRVTKLLVFIEENHSLNQMSSGVPYTFAMAKRYDYATNYTAIRHPSLPNYIAIAGGRTYGIADDRPPSVHRLGGRSVFGQARRGGKSAEVYADGMSSSCALTNGGDDYDVKHNPWAYWRSGHLAIVLTAHHVSETLRPGKHVELQGWNLRVLL